MSSKQIAIIGGGPAGLMAAETLSRSPANISVHVYDAMATVGRKFLMAGKGGLNISHAEPLPDFLARYSGHATDIAPTLYEFSPSDLREWVHELGITTFVGSSGRVFPAGMKAAPLLRAWLRRLREAGVLFHTRHLWTGWSAEGALLFQSPAGEQTIRADAVVFAMGGASWPQLGSTGNWQAAFLDQGIEVSPLRPSNCGFDMAWSEHFKARFAGQAVKTVLARLDPTSQGIAGEFVITETGVEGGLIYSLSAALRDSLALTASATLYLDLLPDKETAWLLARLNQPRGKASTANYLRKCLGLEGVKAGLLRELSPASVFANPAELVAAIKALPLKLLATRPIAEAISSAGGVPFAALDGNLMVTTKPGIFCAGEMLDWEAPTGGYLLTACFASGRRAGRGILAWLESNGGFDN